MSEPAAKPVQSQSGFGTWIDHHAYSVVSGLGRLLRRPWATASGTWNAINGHDRPIEPDDGLVDDLQYSCIFPLAEPRACDGEATSASCDCAIEPGLDGVLDYATNNPLCYDVDTDSYGTTQYYAKAYPAPRIVQVLKDVGVQGVLASICPKQLSAADQQDYAYRPVIRALLQNVASQVAR